MLAAETYAAVRRLVFIEGNSRREATRVFGLICVFDGNPSAGSRGT